MPPWPLPFMLLCQLSAGVQAISNSLYGESLPGVAGKLLRQQVLHTSRSSLSSERHSDKHPRDVPQTYGRAVALDAKAHALELQSTKHNSTLHQRSAGLTVAFLKPASFSTRGSSKVRADEMAAILTNMSGSKQVRNLLGNLSVISAESSTCEQHCDRRVQSSLEDLNQFVVHVDILCECALRFSGNHIYDPIDWQIERGGVLQNVQFFHPCGKNWGSHTCIKGLFVVTAELQQEVSHRLRAFHIDGRAFFIPHHHSNYLGRRHVVADKKSTDELVIGFAGGRVSQQEAHAALSTCLQSQGLNGVRLEVLADVPCNMSQAQGPSPRGDCFARKLASFDVGVVWHQRTLADGVDDMDMIESLGFEEKPAQRLVNMLAVGLPTVSHAGYVGHREVLKTARFLPMAANETSLCSEVVKLLTDPTLRLHASREALELASWYSPSQIGALYIESFRTLQSLA